MRSWRKSLVRSTADRHADPMSQLMLKMVEQAWTDDPGAALVAACVADIEDRYAELDLPTDPTPDEIHVPGARPAPPAAAPDSPRWEVDAADVVRPRGAFVVAHLDGEPVGCGALRPLPGGDPSIAEVKRMYTAPEARGRGVARALLRHLAAVAAELGYAQVVLETGTRQPEAMALYAAEGWAPLAPYGQYCGEHLSRCFVLDLE
jgi:GNAT superfamily N-acetyltransferase